MASLAESASWGETRNNTYVKQDANYTTATQKKKKIRCNIGLRSGIYRERSGCKRAVRKLFFFISAEFQLSQRRKSTRFRGTPASQGQFENLT